MENGGDLSVILKITIFSTRMIEKSQKKKRDALRVASRFFRIQFSEAHFSAAAFDILLISSFGYFELSPPLV